MTGGTNNNQSRHRNDRRRLSVGLFWQCDSVDLSANVSALPDAPITELTLARPKSRSLFRDEDVRRLDIAVDNSLWVRRVLSVGDFDGNTENVPQFHGPISNGVLEGLPSRYSKRNQGGCVK